MTAYLGISCPDGLLTGVDISHAASCDGDDLIVYDSYKLDIISEHNMFMTGVAPRQTLRQCFSIVDRLLYEGGYESYACAREFMDAVAEGIGASDHLKQELRSNRRFSLLCGFVFDNEPQLWEIGWTLLPFHVERTIMGSAEDGNWTPFAFWNQIEGMLNSGEKITMSEAEFMMFWSFYNSLRHQRRCHEYVKMVSLTNRKGNWELNVVPMSLMAEHAQHVEEMLNLKPRFTLPALDLTDPLPHIVSCPATSNPN